VKAQAEWTVRTEGPVASYSAAKRGKLIGIGLSAKHQGQRSYQTALTGRRHDCTRPAKLKHRLNHLAKRAPSRHDATVEGDCAAAPCAGGIVGGETGEQGCRSAKASGTAKAETSSAIKAKRAALIRRAFMICWSQRFCVNLLWKFNGETAA